MRRLTIVLLLAATGCAHDAAGPLLSLDGASFALTSTSDGALPVLLNRFTDPNDGSTRTDYIIADQITFVRGQGRAIRALTSSQTLVRPGMPTESLTGTLQSTGTWFQAGDKVVISWAMGYGPVSNTVVDTLQLVNLELRDRIVRQVCDQCAPGTPLDLVYLRGATQ